MIDGDDAQRDFAFIPYETWYALCKRDQRAWDALDVKYKRIVAAVCYRLTGDLEEAKDLCQETWMRIAQNIGNFDSSRPFLSWFRTIARNCFLDHRRRYRPVHISLDTGDLDRERASYPDDEIVTLLRSLRLREAIKSLPDELRIPLVRFCLKGEPYEIIAESMSLKPATVRMRVSRAKRELRALLVA